MKIRRKGGQNQALSLMYKLKFN